MLYVLYLFIATIGTTSHQHEPSHARGIVNLSGCLRVVLQLLRAYARVAYPQAHDLGMRPGT